jgi:hypothetical protein
MTARLIIAAMLLVTNPLSCAPSPNSPPTVRLVDYGIIKLVGPFVHHSDPSTAAGFTSRGPGNSVFEKRSTDVPAKQGIAFGIRYRIEGLRPGQTVTIEEVIRHPPMTQPDGTVVSEERTQDQVSSDSGVIDQKFLYRLGKPYEVVPGDWSLAVAINGTTAIEQHFKLRPFNQ